MHRPISRAALALALAGLVAGCQDYNFNPVGHCVIQPGSERVTLSSVSTADVLFVVDDSGSMGGKQAKLSAAFNSFIGNLNTYNVNRVAGGLEPFDFHLAVTTTSIFYYPPSASTPRQTYLFPDPLVRCNAPGGVAWGTPTVTGSLPGGQYTVQVTAMAGEFESVPLPAGTQNSPTSGALTVTWTGVQPGLGFDSYRVYLTPPSGLPSGYSKVYFAAPINSTSFTITALPATSGTTGSGVLVATGANLPPICGTGYACFHDVGGATTFPFNGCGGYQGDFCCSAQSNSGAPQKVDGCQNSLGVKEGDPYPQGNFVGIQQQPRVLHYDKQLFGTYDANAKKWVQANPATATNKQGFTAAQLNGFFQSNVKVGTCGSGEEQGLQAGRLAIQKALSGLQRDYYSPTSSTYVSGGVLADWPHANAKLVVVYIGDEDDCSSPNDATQGIKLYGVAGNDSCTADASKPLDQQQEFRVADLVMSLTQLGRPLGAAFVVDAVDATSKAAPCTDEGCVALANTNCCDSTCTGSASVCSTGTCGGQAPGSRFLQASGALRQTGADVVDGSVCSTSTEFADILGKIADVVKPPSGLQVPTQPADPSVVRLTIQGTDGKLRKTCYGPALPPTYATAAAAASAGFDWWFTATGDQASVAQRAPTAASRFVYINPAGGCVANPGETYAFEYLGQVPTGGCATTQDCVDALGGSASTMTCYAGTDSATGVCIPPTATNRGTCVCGSAATVCPKG